MIKTKALSEVDQIVRRHNARASGLVGMLQDIQGKYNYLPQEALIHLAEKLDIPLSRTYSLATYYKAFSLNARGKHLVSMCLGTACHVRGAARVLAEVQRLLKIKSGQTSADLKFTLETVNCLGACALGPLMVINGEYFAKMNVPKVNAILKKYAQS